MSDYGALIGMQCPGALADSSKYNIDGCCFAADDHDSVMVGKIVRVKSVTDGYKEISDVFTASTLPYGVAMRTNICTHVDESGYMVYPAGEPMNVVSNGRVWVLSENIDQAPQFGTLVKVGPDGFANANGFEIPGWTYTGGWQKWNSIFYMVEIQVNQNAPFIYHSADTLVNGVYITANYESPQHNTTIVTLNAEVSPRDATNHLGHWTISGDNIAKIVDNGDNTAVIVPNGGDATGIVYANWSADDLSGVRGMIKFEFTNNVIG